MNTDPTLTDRPEFLDGIALLHGAMRRDAGRLARAIGRVTSVDDARAVARWFAKFEREVEHHHLREDDVVWPMLLERAPEFRDALAPLEADHHALDVVMADTRAALARLSERADEWNRARAVDAAGALGALLDDHLDREEAAAFPLLSRAFDAQGFAELEKQLLSATPKRLVAFELGFAFDGLPPAEAAEMLADLPLPIRGLYRLWWKPAYERLVAPLAAAA